MQAEQTEACGYLFEIDDLKRFRGSQDLDSLVLLSLDGCVKGLGSPDSKLLPIFVLSAGYILIKRGFS